MAETARPSSETGKAIMVPAIARQGAKVSFDGIGYSGSKSLLRPFLVGGGSQKNSTPAHSASRGSSTNAECWNSEHVLLLLQTVIYNVVPGETEAYYAMLTVGPESGGRHEPILLLFALWISSQCMDLTLLIYT
jgi:hypothetical protein